MNSIVRDIGKEDFTLGIGCRTFRESVAFTYQLPTFARNEKEKRLLTVWRAFRGVGSPYILPPGTPKDKVQILETAMRNVFKDPEFPAYFKKLVADEVSPLNAAELRKVIAEIPRDKETLDLLRVMSGAGALPPR